MKAPIPAAPEPRDLRAWLDPGRAGLVVIDAQHDFAATLGAAKLALAAASRLAAAARAAGAAVVFVRLETTPKTDSPAWAKRISRLGGSPQTQLALCRAGAPGADFHGIAPEPGDLVIVKRRYSAFFETGLDAALKARGLDTLVVCGLTTDCCVESTVRDAFHLDYHLFVAADACAGADLAAHRASLASLARCFAIIVETNAVVAAWADAK